MTSRGRERLAMMLMLFGAGMGFGRSLEAWPGPIVASAVSLIVAVVALVLLVNAYRP